MINILLLSSVFLIVLLIGCIILVAKVYDYCQKRDIDYSRNFNKIEHELGVIKKLINDDVSVIVKNIKKLYGQS